MKIKLINPNTTVAMTQSIQSCAEKYARKDTEIYAVNPTVGVNSIECYVDEYLAIPGVLREVQKGEQEGADAYVLSLIHIFTADGRIDFRELVKDLAAVFRTRIELRQIGVRDETKIRGGIGICGRPLCCNTYLSEFAAVSIKMAKEQSLSLNPTKISGVCGRLMCCLTNEEETYEELNSQLPTLGDTVTTPEGLSGTVHSLSVLRKLVKVIVVLENDEKEIREYRAEELKFRPRRKKAKVSKEEMKKLAVLEKGEGASKLDDN